ncbi:claudin-15-like isoform X1 [Python bivittatus]|uniref:Claudin n=1 Tax=Python bivittatus TaxID=176946 RepID=A0A9F5MXB9_PYTBI|nr:claudin-15-like isoform X1 [Python bivittatus]
MHIFLIFSTMSLVLELTGFIFTLGGWVIIGTTLSNSYWKVSTVLGNVITTSTLYENLWHSCAEESTGISNCKAFNSLLALPAFIQACRALMITSLVLGMGGTLLALLGLKCTELGSSDERKARLSIMSGMIFVLAGLSSMVALSWYAANITAEFFDPLYAGTKYELGYALYLGWAGSLLSIAGGILLTCSSCKGNQRDHGYHYAASATVDEPQIYIKQAKTVTSAKDYV